MNTQNLGAGVVHTPFPTLFSSFCLFLLFHAREKVKKKGNGWGVLKMKPQYFTFWFAIKKHLTKMKDFRKKLIYVKHYSSFKNFG